MGGARSAVPFEKRMTTPMLTNMPLELRRQIEEVAWHQRIPLAEVVRRAVRQYVAEHSGTKKSKGKAQEKNA